MYRKTGADIGFADETPKRSSVPPPFALDYDPDAPFGEGLFRDAAPGCLKANFAGIAYKRNF